MIDDDSWMFDFDLPDADSGPWMMRFPSAEHRSNLTTVRNVVEFTCDGEVLWVAKLKNWIAT